MQGELCEAECFASVALISEHSEHVLSLSPSLSAFFSFLFLCSELLWSCTVCGHEWPPVRPNGPLLCAELSLCALHLDFLAIEQPFSLSIPCLEQGGVHALHSLSSLKQLGNRPGGAAVLSPSPPSRAGHLEWLWLSCICTLNGGWKSPLGYWESEALKALNET